MFVCRRAPVFICFVKARDENNSSTFGFYHYNVFSDLVVSDSYSNYSPSDTLIKGPVVLISSPWRPTE